MYVITYLNDGTITTIGRVEMDTLPEKSEEGFLYLKEFPYELPIDFADYKVRDGTIAYEPVPNDEPDEEEITYG